MKVKVSMSLLRIESLCLKRGALKSAFLFIVLSIFPPYVLSILSQLKNGQAFNDPPLYSHNAVNIKINQLTY
ncbi:hypothetical protein D3C78_880090 [compost metagenome]